MSKKIIIFLLAALLSWSWATFICRAGEEPPPRQTEAEPPRLNLGDLLPSSQEPQPEARPMHTITDSLLPSRQDQNRREAARPAQPQPAQAEEPRAAQPQQTRTKETQAAQPERTETAPPPAQRDLSSLAGCWVEDNPDQSASSGGYAWLGECRLVPHITQYCFDSQGQGTRTIRHYDSSQTFQGALRVAFDRHGRLIMHADRSDPIAGTAADSSGVNSYCPELIVIGHIQEGVSLRGLVNVLGDCASSTSFPLTLDRQKP